ncbi:hypothetical protein WH47_10199, partial [Habropoda laboriosa]
SQQAIFNLGQEAVPHPAYSPTDFYLFRPRRRHLCDEKAEDEFVVSKPQHFFHYGIRMLYFNTDLLGF